MAILIVNSAPGPAKPIVETIRAAAPADDIWLIDHYDRSVHGDTVDRFWHVSDLTFGFYDAEDIDRCPAIDGATLTAAADLESVIMKMLEKNEKYNKLVWASDQYRSLWHPRGLPDISYDYNARKTNLIDHIRVWEHHLKNDIDAVLITTIPNHGYDYVIYYLSRRLGVPVIVFDQLPIAGRLLPLRQVEGPNLALIDEIERIRAGRDHHQPIPDRVQEYFDFQLNKDAAPVPEYINKTKLELWEYRVLPINTNSTSKLFYHLIMGAIARSRNEKHRKRMAAFSYIFNFWKQIRLRSNSAYYESLVEPAEDSCDYVYFPLHYQPEISTCPLGGHYAHPELIAALIADLLPRGWLLYVREHPLQRALGRSPHQYQSMARHPRVRLRPVDEDHYDLISGARAVATVTGTPGIEALCREVPVLVFGETLYAYCKGAHRVRTRQECATAIEAIAAGHKPTVDDVIDVFIAAYNLSIEGTNMGAYSYVSKHAQPHDPAVTHRNIAAHFVETVLGEVTQRTQSASTMPTVKA